MSDKVEENAVNNNDLTNRLGNVEAKTVELEGKIETLTTTCLIISSACCFSIYLMNLCKFAQPCLQ